MNRALFLATLIISAILFSFASKSVAGGDVDAVVVGNNLMLIGDAQSNLLHISENGFNVIVEPMGKTTINGSSDLFDTGIRLGALNNLSIDLRGGNDIALIVGVSPLGNLNSKFGVGNDFFCISKASVGNNTTIRMGGGADNLLMEIGVVGGDFEYSGGAGNDGAVLFGPMITNGNLTTKSGGGNDCFICGLGGAVEVLGHVNDSAGAGADESFFGGTFHQDFNYIGGTGSDFVILGDPSPMVVEGDLDVRSGSGNDLLQVGTLGVLRCVGGINYLAGAGEDQAIIGADADFRGSIFALMGADNDELLISEMASFVVPGTLSGGGGIDNIDPNEEELELLGFNVINFED